MAAGWMDDYPGSVSVSEAYDLLGREHKAQLVDVRTQAEWAFVGVPDLSEHGRDAVLAEWQRYPTMDVVEDFVSRLERELHKRGVGKADPVLFLCRSGARSSAAVKAMTAAGWVGSRNIEGGFEGPLDQERHRGHVDGWKAAGLPWAQS